MSLRADLPTIMDRIQNTGEVDAMGYLRMVGLEERVGYPVFITRLQVTASQLAFQDKAYPPSKFTLWIIAESKTHPGYLLAQPAIPPLTAWSHLHPPVPRYGSLMRHSICRSGSIVLKMVPCGTYIPIGRNDDRVDMFDSRFIKYGPVSRVFHGKPTARTPWKSLWCITRLDAISSILAAWDRVLPNSCLSCILSLFIFPCLGFQWIQL